MAGVERTAADGEQRMSVGRVGRDAEIWTNYVRIVARNLVDGRARLTVRHRELVHNQPATVLVPVARTAANKIVAAMTRRVSEFAPQRALRRGPTWDTLEAEYLEACAEIRGVCTALSLAVALLLNDENSLLSSEPESLARLTFTQRAFLMNARARLEARTSQVLTHAEDLFVASQREATSSAQVSGSD